ncbi:unnamed protein product [Schistosoma curassoni]|uniref:Reverse transcriptase domain-containing protein n=1 Tax=Schistosoma curassoni TaxID=6186 RepID=A0A183JMI6_9TREM|nr:unnamed protein product [Schistosoma curassoni]
MCGKVDEGSLIILMVLLFNKVKNFVNAQLQDQQTGFRKDGSCTDRIATLQITVKQSSEWNSPFYIKLIDYENAFDIVDRTTLWRLLPHYSVHEKIVNIIRNFYDGLNCKIVHGEQMTTRSNNDEEEEEEEDDDDDDGDYDDDHDDDNKCSVNYT